MKDFFNPKRVAYFLKARLVVMSLGILYILLGLVQVISLGIISFNKIPQFDSVWSQLQKSGWNK